jgi:hypothetical protein
MPRAIRATIRLARGDREIDGTFTRASPAIKPWRKHCPLDPISEEEASMPQILVVTDLRDDTSSTVVYKERINLSDLESDHFSGQLVERVGWAVLDADALEHKGGAETNP